MLLISDKYKFALVTIPKNACTTLRYWFHYLEQDKINELLSLSSTKDNLENIHKIVKKKYLNRKINDEYQKFSTLRNPWLRLASCYFDKIETKNFLKGLKLESISEFIAFLEIINLNGEHCNRHWKTQHSFFKDIKIDKFIKVEDFQNDFDEMLDNIGLERIVLPNWKRNENRTRKYNNLYSKKEAKIIEKLYKKDVETGGYSCPKYMIDHNKKYYYVTKLKIFIRFSKKYIRRKVKNFNF